MKKPVVERKKTTLYIDNLLWIEAKHKAIDEEISLSRLFEDFLRNYVGKKDEK